LLAASWVLDHRRRLSRDGSPPPKIILVLPFLSIIDQTVQEYRDLLSSHVDAGDLLSYHSLSERTFDPELDSKSQEFFLDTWQSDVVITTFDQLLLALFSPRTKHQLRFHNLADALIVLDEVQSVPCILWEPLRRALTGRTEMGSTHVLAMSATQPGFLPESLELIRDPSPSDFFGRMHRYRLVLRHRTPMLLSEFIGECRARLAQWKGQRVLITLNTRRSARLVYDALISLADKIKLPVFFITGDRTPRDRLAAIRGIKENKPCLVVSTQCVEAGVDIDMDLVIRDFGPLDSLIQISGRCNRNGNRSRGTVEVVSLLDDLTHREFAGMIYTDRVLLQATSEVLGGLETVDEEHLYDLTLRYFDILRREKNLGADVVESWINWEEIQSVRSLFRGVQPPQLSFVVIDQDPELSDLLKSTLDIIDRWEKKRAFRVLAPRMAALTVSITTADNSKLDPYDFGEPFPSDASPEVAWFWLVNPGVYDRDRGLNSQLGSDQESSWGMML
jgi:CRISPR-associated endonuclease/helicase Cas3